MSDVPNELKAELRRSYDTVVQSIPKHVVLIAVSKTQSISKVQSLYEFGQRDFGENYAQELVNKATEMRSRGYADVKWHFIGHLQTNKVKMILPFISMIHSIDSARLAEEVSKRMTQLRPGERLPICVEVNLGMETSKGGVAPGELATLVSAVSKLPGIELKGLMCIPPLEGGGGYFAQLRQLEESLRPHTQGMLSMGMSHDYIEAIEFGATHVRVGTALFGKRDTIT